MRAYIFCKSFGLKPDKINIEPGLYIAADSGLETAEVLGVKPDIIMGDFDSVSLSASEIRAKYENSRVIEYLPEKDDTDSMLCMKYALEHGYKDIIIVGGTGGRIDHELVNLATMRYIRNHGGTGVITDGFNRVSYLASGSMRVYKNYKYVSIMPISPELCGVTLTGFLYNLENAGVKFEEPYTISNEIAGEYGDIKIAEGEAFVCECD